MFPSESQAGAVSTLWGSTARTVPFSYLLLFGHVGVVNLKVSPLHADEKKIRVSLHRNSQYIMPSQPILRIIPIFK
jgi:hypothetical protein